MLRPRLLDLFCGAGGAAMGYHRAGFDIVGVDHQSQPNYPFPFIRADVTAIDFAGFDAVHASPPCQVYSTIGKQQVQLGRARERVDLVAETRDLLEQTRLPYVIENVPGAPLRDPVLICGSMFDPPMDIRRHRLFEANWPLQHPMWPCRHKLWAPRYRSFDKRRRKLVSGTVPVHGNSRQLASVVTVAGHLDFAGEMSLRARVMGIDWMSANELSQAIPPAYTELIGHQLLQHLRVTA